MRMATMVRRGTLAGVALMAGEALYATARPLPSFRGFDISGSFGDPALPALRLTVLGDSTVTGPGLDDPADTFVRQIVATLTDRYRVDLVSVAKGGSRAIDVLREQVPRVIEFDSDLTLVSVGGNDVLRGTPIRSFELQLEAIVVALRSVSRAVILMGVGDIGTVPRLPLPLDRLVSATGRIADRAHGRVAERHRVAKVDHWGASAQAFRTDPSVFSPDRFHPGPSLGGHGHARDREGSAESRRQHTSEAHLNLATTRIDGRVCSASGGSRIGAAELPRRDQEPDDQCRRPGSEHDRLRERRPLLRGEGDGQ